jgi:hypothetical protein
LHFGQIAAGTECLSSASQDDCPDRFVFADFEHQLFELDMHIMSKGVHVIGAI